MNAAQASWLKFLNPETLRTNLIATSVFIAAYEILKDSLVDQIRNFYIDGIIDGEATVSAEYATKVLALDPKRNVFRSSIAWLKNSNVIDEADENAILDLTQHRNDVAHELPKFLSDASCKVQLEKLHTLVEIVTKIDRWWILNFEIPTNPDMDGREIDEMGITSGNMLYLHLLFGLTSGAHSTELYDQFIAATSKNQNSSKQTQK